MVRRLGDIQYGPEDWQLVDVVLPDSGGPWPMLVFFHGGGFIQGTRKDGHIVRYLTELAERGIAGASGDYALVQPPYPDPDDWQANLDARFAAVADMRLCFEFLHARAGDHGIDTSRMFIGGASAGGAGALTAGMSDPEDLGGLDSFNLARGMVICWGNMAGPDGILTEPTGNPPINYFQQGDPSVCCIHGTQDEQPNTPYECSVEIIRQATESDVFCNLHPLVGAGHGPWDTHMTEIVDTTEAFIRDA